MDVASEGNSSTSEAGAMSHIQREKVWLLREKGHAKVALLKIFQAISPGSHVSLQRRGKEDRIKEASQNSVT